MINTDADALSRNLAQEREQLRRSATPLLNTQCQHHYSSHQIIWQNEGVCLRAFIPERPRHKRPLVLCYALVNRPWILDLAPGSSLIEALVAQGFSVYLIDWGQPERCQRFRGLEHYVDQIMHACIQAAASHAASPRVNLAGICQGGVFSLCYAAIHPELVNRLVTLVTPVDFHAADFTLSQLYRGVDIQQLVSAYGNIPGPLVTQVFSGLQPMRLGQLKHLTTAPRLVEKPDSVAQYMLMERWLNDCPDLAGRALQQFVELFFQHNRLLDGKFDSGNFKVDMSRLAAPVLNIYGKHDHLVPPNASRALEQICKRGHYQSLEIGAGHIGTLMGNKALKSVPAAIQDWLQETDQPEP